MLVSGEAWVKPSPAALPNIKGKVKIRTPMFINVKLFHLKYDEIIGLM